MTFFFLIHSIQHQARQCIFAFSPSQEVLLEFMFTSFKSKNQSLIALKSTASALHPIMSPPSASAPPQSGNSHVWTLPFYSCKAECWQTFNDSPPLFTADLWPYVGLWGMKMKLEWAMGNIWYSFKFKTRRWTLSLQLYFFVFNNRQKIVIFFFFYVNDTPPLPNTQF